MIYYPVIPSVPFLNKTLLQYLTNHPLFIHPIVYHPITEEYIPVSQYRFMGGIPVNEGLTCSIYPGFSSNVPDAPPSPATISASVSYRPFQTGLQDNHEEARYSFVVQFTHRGLTVDGFDPSADDELIRVPANAIIDPEQIGLVDLDATKNIDVYLNPSLDIVANYLELTRLALCDVEYHREFAISRPEAYFPGTFKNIEIIHQDYNSLSWSKNDSAIWCSGHLLISLSMYVSKGWRDKFRFPLSNIKVQANSDDTKVIIKE